ncbi:hypothetical protein C2U71_17705 [Burkholderia ubonensis]|nr:hypothetical protein C2U71_17705 [Burkholderia ubonensis]
MSASSSRRTTSHGRTGGPSQEIALQVMVPARIKRAVSVRAAQEGTTQRTIILSALKAVGFVVSDDELCDKRKVR